MTFDARSGAKSSKGNGNLFFGIAVVLAVGGAFFLTLNFPSKQASDSPQTADTPSIVSAQSIARSELDITQSKAADRFFRALNKVDAKAHSDLLVALKKAEDKPADVQFEIILKQSGNVLKAYATDLARADVKHADSLLNLTRTQLKSAARSGSPFCSGATYATLADGDVNKAKLVSKSMLSETEALHAYMYNALEILMLATLDGQANPIAHGAMTPRDEAAMQGVMMSMISDPQVMPLLLASQGGNGMEDALRKVNVCELAATAVVAIKTLPQETKGRAWSRIVMEAELGGADMSKLRSLGSY